MNASVRLLEGDEVVWEGATDATGVCSFSLGLASSRGVESGDDWVKYELEVDSGGYEHRRVVGFTSDTPIVIETRAYTRPFSELLAVAVVVILSVIVLLVLRRART